jgi:ATP-binding cassette subfamily B protein
MCVMRRCWCSTSRPLRWTRAEVAIYRQFRDVAQGRLVPLISHRPGSARLADRILVLAGRRMSESGMHAELLANGGRYAML